MGWLLLSFDQHRSIFFGIVIRRQTICIQQTTKTLLTLSTRKKCLLISNLFVAFTFHKNDDDFNINLMLIFMLITVVGFFSLTRVPVKISMSVINPVKSHVQCSIPQIFYLYYEFLLFSGFISEPQPKKKR